MNSSGPAQAFVVADPNGRINYTFSDPSSETDLRMIVTSAGKLQPEVESFLRAASDGNSGAPMHTLFLDGEYVLRAARLVGIAGTLFVLSVERDQNCESLSRAARRHLLTRRETSVLKLILDGLGTSEIAEALGISEHTVQGYFKRLLAKTGARNRPSMIARVLNWQPPSRGQEAEMRVERAV